MRTKRITKAVCAKFRNVVDSKPECFKHTSGGCIEWQGAVDGNGYAVMACNHRMYKMSRVSWTAANGPIPQGVFCLHLCDNPKCISVSHLMLGDQKLNMQHRSERGRGNWAHGETHFLSKVTHEQVMEIRQAYADGVSQRSLGETYGIAQGNICRMVQGYTYAHLPVIPRIDVRKAKVRELFLEGLSYDHIQKATGISAGCLWNYTRDLPRRIVRGGK